MSNRTLARIGGALYLPVAVLGGFSQYVRLSAVVPSDPAATAVNVAAHSTLFRIAFTADLADFTCFLAVGIVMYALLRHVNPDIAVAMLAINAVSVAVQAVNMLNHAGALLAATDSRFAAVASPQALVLPLLEMHRLGYLVAQIFFGLYLLPLGYLVYRSGYFPKVVGLVLITGCGGYLAGVGIAFASPGFDSGIATFGGMLGGLAELVFLLWLLIRGVSTPDASAAVTGAPRAANRGALTWKA